ncbi:metallophosphoesterase [candidate division FCPU426 bacterium]|nr:metallophosphoesterase [candidate division FCPU426 bacterium]
MIGFLLFYLLIYGGTHGFLFYRVRQVMALPLWGVWVLAVFLALMVAAPVASVILERLRWEWLARPLAYAAFIWMGWLWFFFSAYAVIGIARLATGLVKMILPQAGAALFFTPGAGLAAAAAAALAVCCYAVFEAGALRVETVEIKTDKLPAQAAPITVVQISDVHIGQIVRRTQLQAIMKKVAALKPDLFVSTGDLLDAQVDGCEDLCAIFAEAAPRLGKYAITGNHEFYSGLEKTLSFTQNAGFTLLRGEAAVPGGLINVVGIDDRTGKYFGNFKGPAEEEILRRLDQGKYTLLLKHQPRVAPAALGLFDLQLSGHTHNGQIVPFNLFTRLAFRYNTGLHRLPRGSWIYTNRGTGTWGPPMRFLAPPEITRIVISPAGAEKPAATVPSR